MNRTVRSMQTYRSERSRKQGKRNDSLLTHLKASTHTAEGAQDEIQRETQKETQHRIFVLSMLAIVLSCLALSMSIFKTPKAQFVVVDMALLLRKKAATLVSEKKHKIEGERGDASPELAHEARKIRTTIEHYAASNKVIVVAKGAVFGGNVKEVTDEIEILL